MMKMHDNKLFHLLSVVVTIGSISLGIVLLPVFAHAAATLGDRLTLHGYARGELSYNLENPPETSEDDTYDLQMLRSTLYVDASLDMDWARFVGIGRGVMEYIDDYQRRLDDLSPTNDLTKEYQDFDLREYYVDIPAGRRLNFRLGKQIVTWGRVDFFRAMDRIHGEDWTWRSFLPSKEEIKKPLFLANIEAQVPEANGSLQLLLRPGLDRDRDIGDTLDLFGGRWSAQPNKGVDFLDPSALGYNADFGEGDKEEPTWGVRWSGVVGQLEYTLNYLRTLGPEPTVNPNAAVLNSLPFASGAESYQEAPTRGALGDIVFPARDLFGITANYYWNSIDLLTRTEIAYEIDKPYQAGSAFFIPGLQKVVEKDTLWLMLAFEKNLGFLQTILNSREKPSLLIQLFDRMILDYDESEDIVHSLGNSAPANEHDPNLTIATFWSYMNGKVKPGLAWVGDIKEGGGLIIPSVDFEYGDHWRFRVEADIFYTSGSTEPGERGEDTYTFGLFDNSSQLYFRVDYQF